MLTNIEELKGSLLKTTIDQSTIAYEIIFGSIPHPYWKFFSKNQLFIILDIVIIDKIYKFIMLLTTHKTNLYILLSDFEKLEFEILN